MNSSDDSTTVYVPSNGTGPSRKRYHTDPECDRLLRARRIYEKERGEIGPDVEHCSFCSGEFESATVTNPMKRQKQLLELDPEDIGLSPMEER